MDPRSFTLPILHFDTARLSTSTKISIVGGALLLIQLLATALVSFTGKRRKIDLPGPSGWPLIGIGLDLPARPRKLLNQWAEKYGDTFKVRLGWYDWVFFDSRDAVKEVFDRQVRTSLDVDVFDSIH